MTTGGEGTQIRPYDEADESGVEGLLDAGSDRLWVRQGHRLHGVARDGEQWRRTLVAQVAGELIGAVTVARNRVHPGRYNLAVEVAAAHRRRGVARALIEHAQHLVPEPLPLAAKMRPADAAAVALLRRVGGRVYQRCPGLCPDPTAPQVAAWAAGARPDPGATVRPLADIPREGWVELWVGQYLWVHEQWSPAAEGPLRELALGIVAEVDPELASVAIRDGQVSAVAWVFDGHDGTAEVVAETTQQHAPRGVTDVAACLARSLARLAERDVARAAIDGHDSDPHLAPVLGRFPNVPREPLHLVEIASTTAAPVASPR